MQGGGGGMEDSLACVVKIELRDDFSLATEVTMYY